MLGEAVEVRFGLHMDGEARRPGVEILVERPKRLLDHQMNVEGEVRGAAEGPEDERADGQIRDEAPVHDVEVDGVGARPLAGGDLLREPPEVRRQKRGGDLHARVGHGDPSAEATTNERTSFLETGKPDCGNWRRIVPAAAPS